MRILVSWGSKHGGTEGIARMVVEALEAEGLEVVAAPASEARHLETFDAAIIGGALYAQRWPASLRWFVKRNLGKLRKMPVWFFSSGPLDDSAERQDIPATAEVAVLAERVGALGHVTFGGRLEPDVEGFPASAMAKTKSGDWRRPERIRAWAAELARALPEAVPGTPVEPPARSLSRLLTHGIAGWGLCSATMGVLLQLVSVTAALILHAIAAPLIFVAISGHYFRARGARDPLPTAFAWMAIVASLDLIVIAGALMRSLEMFGSFAGTWLPFALIFLATWAAGVVMAFMPRSETKQTAEPKQAAA